jgi:hypothetical protein
MKARLLGMTRSVDLNILSMKRPTICWKLVLSLLFSSSIGSNNTTIATDAEKLAATEATIIEQASQIKAFQAVKNILAAENSELVEANRALETRATRTESELSVETAKSSKMAEEISFMKLKMATAAG